MSSNRGDLLGNIFEKGCHDTGKKGGAFPVAGYGGIGGAFPLDGQNRGYFYRQKRGSRILKKASRMCRKGRFSRVLFANGSSSRQHLREGDVVIRGKKAELF